MKLPKQFNSWIELYDNLAKNVSPDVMSRGGIMYQFTEEKLQFSIQDIKNKVLEELLDCRLKRSEARKLEDYARCYHGNFGPGSVDMELIKRLYNNSIKDL